MTFPQTILPLKGEIFINSAWTDITSYIRGDPGVTITRGRSDEGKQSDPSTCVLQLDNTDGRFSPRNPLGAYYGQIGRNTPIRMSVTQATSYLYVDRFTGTTVGSANVSTPDAASLDITGDIDLRFDADLDSWRDPESLVSKYGTAGNQRSYAMLLTAGGVLEFWWSTAGSTTLKLAATLPLPVSVGRMAVRATLDVDNGASGATATFYTAPTIAGPWVVLDTVTQAGTTSIFSSSSNLYLLDSPAAVDTGTTSIRGRVFAAQVYNGIGGTLVANPDFTAQTSGATSFTDSTGKLWTLSGSSVSLSTLDRRFVGEVSSWPQNVDISGVDVTTALDGSGVMRRITQGQAVLSSTLHRVIQNDAPVAYWTCEDGEGASLFASALSGGRPLRPIGSPTLATNTDHPGSTALPEVNGSKWDGVVVPYTSTNSVWMFFALSVPTTGAANGAILARFNSTGTYSQWDVVYGTGGTLNLLGYTGDVASFNLGAFAFGVDGSPVLVGVQVTSDGAGGLMAGLQTYSALDTSGVFVGPNSIATATVGAAVAAHVDPTKVLMDTAIGHIALFSSSAEPPGLSSAVEAYRYETAANRIKRLCSENAIPFYSLGRDLSSAQMGFQRSDTLINLLQEAATTDQGILYEPRDNFGLTYRPRYTMLNQTPAVTASYTGHTLADFNPTDDDLSTVNDVTVTRVGGASYRDALTSGTLSTQPPPLGVGPYTTDVQVSLSEDFYAADQAGWRLNLGTVDESRFPLLGFNLANPDFIAAGLTLAATSLDVGDKLAVDGPPAWLPPDQIQQIAQGFVENLSNFARTISVNCAPASPYTIGRYAAATVSGANQFKYSSDGSTTSSTLTTTSTSLSVATPSGPLWTTDSAQMPIDIIIEGERMNVTAISGATSPQTFTLTRSTNGVVKAHTSTGATVALFRPAVYSFNR